jgi:hypothetical protein
MYKVKFYEGTYAQRQQRANADNAVVYIEQHFNAALNTSANYAMAIVATNASQRSKDIAETYVNYISKIFGNGTYWERIRIGGRGNSNISATRMPAVLLEPYFLTNSNGLEWASTFKWQEETAQCLVDTIRTHYPSGGLVAFSVGHEGNRPGDMGVVTSKGTEAQFARQVLNIAKGMLESMYRNEKRIIRIEKHGKVLAQFTIDRGDEIVLDGDIIRVTG